ncbi:hypothetical protein M2159_000809 [Streptomyces sp. SAI-090]|nr:hypothetical protein [Streptomyces sp. SAI-090]
MTSRMKRMTPVLVQSRVIGWCWTTVSMMDAVIRGSSQMGLCLTVNTATAPASRRRSAWSR